MATSTTSDSATRRRSLPITSAVLIGTLTAAAAATTPAPAKAQCLGSDKYFTVNLGTEANPENYNICVRNTSYAADSISNKLLANSPWYTDEKLAKDLARALTENYNSIQGIAGFEYNANPDTPISLGAGGGSESTGPLFLVDSCDNKASQSCEKGRDLYATAYHYNGNSNGNGNHFTVASKYKPALGDDFIYAYDFNGAGDPVPGPLPLLGAGAAFGWSRRLRRRARGEAGSDLTLRAVPVGDRHA